MDLSSPNDGNGGGDNRRDVSQKNLKVVSMRMLDIAEKLEYLNQQCHKLQVENKGEYACQP